MNKLELAIRIAQQNIETAESKVKSQRKWVESSLNDIDNGCASGSSLVSRAAEYALALSELASAKVALEALQFVQGE